MQSSRRAWLVGVAIAAIAAAVTVALAGSGSEEREPDPVDPPVAEPVEPGEESVENRREVAPERDQRQPEAPEAPESEGRDPDAQAERAVRSAYAAYIEAINDRDGTALCALLAPGSVAELEPPRRRDGCAATLRASIGYADPRGYPVWEATTLRAVERTVVDPGGTARVTALIVTEFADREQPSVESDVAHLERAGGRWRLAKPSVALHRAVGKPDIPPRVLAPP